DQSPVSLGVIELYINRQKAPTLRIDGHFIRYLQNIPDTDAGEDIKRMINSYKYGRSPSSTEISTVDFMGTFSPQDEMEKGGTMGLANWSGIIGKKRNTGGNGVEKVYAFIKYKRNRN
ncbi:MAG: hypothetical protein IJQ66_01610, partial [Clostridia bacterium]|nr:hypothetical protein [Clostridia bacterium]